MYGVLNFLCFWSKQILWFMFLVYDKWYWWGDQRYLILHDYTKNVLDQVIKEAKAARASFLVKQVIKYHGELQYGCESSMIINYPLTMLSKLWTFNPFRSLAFSNLWCWCIQYLLLHVNVIKCDLDWWQNIVICCPRENSGGPKKYCIPNLDKVHKKFECPSFGIGDFNIRADSKRIFFSSFYSSGPIICIY